MHLINLTTMYIHLLIYQDKKAIEDAKRSLTESQNSLTPKKKKKTFVYISFNYKNSQAQLLMKNSPGSQITYIIVTLKNSKK